MRIEAILFGMDGCPDCAIQKTFLDKVFGENNWRYIDIDRPSEDDCELIHKYSIEGAPTLMLIKKSDDKDKVFRHFGVVSSNKIMKFIQNI